MQTTSIQIDSNWRYTELPNPATPEHSRLPWLTARVPGHIHTDLLREGVIPDPFVRLHERDVAWVDESDWIYETTFHLDAAPANPRLIFHGLDTIAEIELNGADIGRCDNMFIAHEFDVAGRLNVGREEAGLNTLRVTLRSAKRVGAARQKRWNAGPDAVEPHWNFFGPRSMVRKAQYMFGWDWGPELISCGIWKPVELVSVPVARIADWKYLFAPSDAGRAVVVVTVDVERVAGTQDTPVILNADISRGNSASAARIDVPVGAGRHSVSVNIPIEDPKLWQPNGSEPNDSPALYDLHLSLISVRQVSIDSHSARIGLRNIELIREPDSDGMGEGFKFRVNGADVFAKGANWIPNDSFPGAITSESLRERLTQARNAGLNMLRVWGGGLYETEEFYNLCDELGLMVWQDFGFACAYYPDTGEYAEATRREASGAVRRIRNHPSLALWCGNNENQQLYQDNWADISPPRYVGEHLYNEILPSVVAAEDPSTSYWPASPYGGEDANSVDVGDCHNWDVWFLRGDWKHYVENGARFCSEFGFAASCGLPAWKTVLSESDYSVSSEAVRRHNKTRKEYETYLGYTELYFPKAHTLSDLVYFSQLNQAEALRCAVEHYRRHKGRCWGTLFWQFNDCWPVQSWSIVDYLGDPKAAYYAAKRFYSPVLLSLVHTEGGANAHLVNDLSHDLTGSLTFELRSFDGESLASRSMEISTGANSAACVADFNLLPAVGRERETYLFCEFQPRVGCNSGNILLQAKPKELCLKDPGLSVTVEESGKDGPIIIVRAQRFAPYTWLRRADDIPLMLSDNFFHLQPGETKRITTHSNPGLSANQLEDVIICRSLWHDCE